jgi:hypothetical protein
MTTFQIILIYTLLAILAMLVCLYIKGTFTIRYEKTVTTINKVDEVQLEIAKANLEEIKKYNENASKNVTDTSKTLQTITAAAQAFMGVNNDEEDRK